MTGSATTPPAVAIRVNLDAQSGRDGRIMRSAAALAPVVRATAPPCSARPAASMGSEVAMASAPT